jgi:hypothetical protein
MKVLLAVLLTLSLSSPSYAAKTEVKKQNLTAKKFMIVFIE